MKLVGSINEEKYRAELAALQIEFAGASRKEEILRAVGLDPSCSDQLVLLERFPDQELKILDVLVSERTIIRLGVPSDGLSPLEIIDQKEIKFGATKLSRMEQIRIAIALELAAHPTKSS